MAKKTNSETTIVLMERYALKTKFQERALLPQECIDRNWLNIWCRTLEDKALKDRATFVTSDGNYVRIKLIASCNNSKGDEVEWLQGICSEIYDMKFETLQSHWFARLGDLSGYWHLIKMELIK